MIDLTPYALGEYPGHSRRVCLQTLIDRCIGVLRPHGLMIRKKGNPRRRRFGPNLVDAGNYYLCHMNGLLIEPDIDPVEIARTLKVPGAFAEVTRGLRPRLPATPSTVRDRWDDHPEQLARFFNKE